jgi:hypothetical protein
MNTSQLVKTFTKNHQSYRYPSNFTRFVMTLLNCKSVTGRIYIYFFHCTNVSPESIKYQVKHQRPLDDTEHTLNVNTAHRQHRTPRTACNTELVLLSDCHGSTAGSGPHAENTVSRVPAGGVYSVRHPSQRGKKTSHWRAKFKEYTLHSDVTTVLYSPLLRRHGQGLIVKKFDFSSK